MRFNAYEPVSAAIRIIAVILNKPFERTDDTPLILNCHVGVNHGCFHMRMTKQFLNGSDVVAILQ